MSKQDIYDKRFDEVTDKLSLLADLLDQHKDAQKAAPNHNWGFIGDLSRLNTDLDEILRYMK